MDIYHRKSFYFSGLWFDGCLQFAYLIVLVSCRILPVYLGDFFLWLWIKFSLLLYIYIYIWGYSRREFNLKIVYFDSICNGHKGLFVIQTTTSRGGVSFMKIRGEVSNISSNLKQKLHRQWCISPKGIFFFLAPLVEPRGREMRNQDKTDLSAPHLHFMIN